MFRWAAFLADAVVVFGALYAIYRWKPFGWWFKLGYWLNAQAWGARADVFGSKRGPSCWTRILPAPVCRAVAAGLLSKVEAPPGGAVEALLEHQIGEASNVIGSWERIAVRHERRGWNRHPHGCYDPTNRRWCALPGCNDTATGRVIGADTDYFCSEHREEVASLNRVKARRSRQELALTVDGCGEFTVVGSPHDGFASQDSIHRKGMR